MQGIDVKASFESLSSSKLNELSSKIKMSKDDAELKKQTDSFESLFVKILLDTSLNMDNPLYPKAPGSDIYNSMFKEQLSKDLSGSFGYSELLFNYLKDKNKNI